MPIRKHNSSVHEPGRLWVLKYYTPAPASNPTGFILASGVRSEFPLSDPEINNAPQRGMIKRIVVRLEGGGTFGVDIVDKAFGASAPDSENIVYLEDPITDETNKIFDIAYSLEDSTVVSGRSLFIGITPASGGGIYKARVYVESRG